LARLTDPKVAPLLFYMSSQNIVFYINIAVFRSLNYIQST